MYIWEIGSRDTGTLGVGILDFGKMDFGILDFGKMDVSGKRPVREKVYSGKLTSGNRSVTEINMPLFTNSALIC